MHKGRGGVDITRGKKKFVDIHIVGRRQLLHHTVSNFHIHKLEECLILACKLYTLETLSSTPPITISSTTLSTSFHISLAIIIIPLFPTFERWVLLRLLPPTP